MKKIYFALLAVLGISAAASAQRNLKFTVEVVKPKIDTNIVTGSTIYPVYRIYNVSSTTADSVSRKDTLKVKMPNLPIGYYTNIYGLAIPQGTYAEISDATISGGFSLPFANIETLVNLTADTFKAKPFTANKQYLWYIQMTGFGVGPSVPGVTTANVTNTSGLDTQRVWINKSTGLMEIANSENPLTLFPNPAVNSVSFEYNFETSMNVTACIVDLAGRQVYAKDLGTIASGKQSAQLDIKEVPAGIYFLQVKSEGSIIKVEKFAVQK
ncbi:T9SS type A sorting domain-containing protein [Rurimicrobium arvi]|uniref:Secretion system C-terminal sorting domain-containing protein n=1 Tax=Rurimicrobium arvi TaxID=2049916 RepID=A0ABP8MHS9_9BACT